MDVFPLARRRGMTQAAGSGEVDVAKRGKRRKRTVLAGVGVALVAAAAARERLAAVAGRLTGRRPPQPDSPTPEPVRPADYAASPAAEPEPAAPATTEPPAGSGVQGGAPAPPDDGA